MWVQNGGFKCNLSNSMGSTGSEGSLGHLTPIQMVLWDLWDPCFSSRGFHFPRISFSPKHPREERTSCISNLNNYFRLSVRVSVHAYLLVNVCITL